MRLGQPTLPVAGAPRYIGPACSDGIQEEIRYVTEALIARNFVPPRAAYDLRDVSVNVQSPEFIASHRERVENSLLREPVTGLRPTVLIRHSSDVVEDLVHPAILGFENGLHVFFRLRGCPVVGPI